MTVVARSLGVSVGLVTRDTGTGLIEMTAPSDTPDNPFVPGAFHDLEPGLLCENVITNASELIVPDARLVPEWASNPDAKLGLVAYLGYPVYWPSGEVYGTICVLDERPRDFTAADRTLLMSARDAIHDSLAGAPAEPTPAGRNNGQPITGSFGLWDFDPTTERLRLSPSVAHTYGYADGSGPASLEEWLNCFPEHSRRRTAEAFDNLTTGVWRTASFAAVLECPAGSRVVRIAARSVPDAARQPVAIVGLQTTISSETIRSLRQVASRTSECSQPSPGEASLEVNAAGHVVDLTPAMARILNLTADQDRLSIQDAFANVEDGSDAIDCVTNALVTAASAELTIFQTRLDEPAYVGVVDTIQDRTRLTGCRLTVLPELADLPMAATDPFLVRDPVTGLPTRVELEYRLRSELKRLRRIGQHAKTLTMAIVEVTNAELIVRGDGHRAAERCLSRISDAIRGADRFVAALGFGYFAVLTRTTGPDGLKRLTDQLRTAAREASSGTGSEPDVSIGAVVVDELQADTAEDVLSAATRTLTAFARPRPTSEDHRLTLVDPAAGHPPPLTTREKQVAELVAQGLPNRAIASVLVIAVRTVEGHLERIRDKLGITSRTQLVVWVLSHPELVDLDPAAPRRSRTVGAADR